MAKRFAKWKISSTFITVGVRESEFVLPEEVKAVYREQVGGDDREVVYLLPNKSDFYAPENKLALGNYLREQNIKVLFVTYLDGRFFDDKLGVPECRFVYWHHVMPFVERVEAAESDWFKTRCSKKWWIYWHLLGRKYYHGSPLFLKKLREHYRTDIERFDSYIALCPEYKDDFVRELKLPQPTANKIFSIINTIDTEREAKLIKSKVIIWVGRLRMVHKRYDRMLEVWRMVQDKLPDWTLKIYGSGDDIAGLIEQNDLQRVEVCGFTNDMSRIYDEAAVLCSTSTYEGWPMVVAEAQSHGVVPISFDCCKGVHSMLGSTVQAGVLVKPFELETYARELVHLCRDDEYRAQLQKNCLEKCKDYAPDVNDAVWQEFFSSVVRF